MTPVEKLAWFLRNGDIHYNTEYAAGCSCGFTEHGPDCQVLKESLDDAYKILKFQKLDGMDLLFYE